MLNKYSLRISKNCDFNKIAAALFNSRKDYLGMIIEAGFSNVPGALNDLVKELYYT